MRRLFVPTLGPSDWRRLLADPEKQWRHSKSAYESAVSWEAARKSARGLPSEIAGLFDTVESFRGATLLLGIPEHQVDLEGGGHASQTDFWALIDAPSGVCSLAIEAKAGESFDKLVSDWLVESPASAGASKRRPSGKPARLKQLCQLLELDEQQAKSCRYQLLHRPAVAILEARRFRLTTAVFLVHAFGKNTDSFNAFQHWAHLLGVEASAERLQRVGVRAGLTLWIGWLGVSPASDATLRDAV
jgi:hypothetical protein